MIDASTKLLLFDRVAEELSQPLLRYLQRLSGSRSTADDLLQETLVKIARCSLATAKIRIHRARRRLKSALEDECRFYRDDADVFRCDRKRPT